jgi:hypothetical protein
MKPSEGPSGLADLKQQRQKRKPLSGAAPKKDRSVFLIMKLGKLI